MDCQSGAAAEVAAGYGPLALVGDWLYFLEHDVPNGQVHVAALQAATK